MNDTEVRAANLASLFLLLLRNLYGTRRAKLPVAGCRLIQITTPVDGVSSPVSAWTQFSFKTITC
jgi:hypothetical protein